jgi:hypothetical protein
MILEMAGPRAPACSRLARGRRPSHRARWGPGLAVLVTERAARVLGPRHQVPACRSLRAAAAAVARPGGPISSGPSLAAEC